MVAYDSATDIHMHVTDCSITWMVNMMQVLKKARNENDVPNYKVEKRS
ncbi:hypothetical protein [Methanolobus tindarius]|nr:hypothetical protein [Methanolobus tindarius]